MEESRLKKIVTRIAWDPPPTDSGVSLTLLEYADPVGPDEEILEIDGQEYVKRKPVEDIPKPYEW